MDTFSGLEMRRIPLSLAPASGRLAGFLNRQGLRMEPLEAAFGVFDADDRLVACAGLAGDIIKCVAIDPEHRGDGLAAPLVSRLMAEAMERGVSNVKVFTKPEYIDTFRALSFRLIAQAPDAAMLESDRHSLDRYLHKIAPEEKAPRTGVIVINANPPTLGHRYLIAKAAEATDRLFVIPVGDDPHTLFPLAERTAALASICREFPGVTLLPASHYCISRATFPTYFLKEDSDAAATHIRLDLDLFCRHIAPALGATVRFAGSEPSDPLTARYNALMAELLPAEGIEFCEIPRMETDGTPVSASRVRHLIREGRCGEALRLVPPASRPYLMAEAAAQALIQELETTPKPGLVDLHDNGAHTDMDPALMRRSIAAIRPVFAEIAAAGARNSADLATLSSLGIKAEEQMMKATGGVNAHRGAIFAMGLTLAAAAAQMTEERRISDLGLQRRIAALAALFPASGNSHGAEMRRRYGIPGAIDSARAGYIEMFRSFLPSLRADRRPDAPQRLLLRIIVSIRDTNIYWRAGEEGAAFAAAGAAALLDDYSEERALRLNDEFVKRRISPGGAADMLALTLFVDSLTRNE